MEYGKFNSVEELKKGYAALEKEFTRKCQELARLQQTNNNVEVPTPAEGAIDATTNVLGTSEDEPRNPPVTTTTVDVETEERTNSSTSRANEYGANGQSDGTVPEQSKKLGSTEELSEKDAELLSALKRLFARDKEFAANDASGQAVAPPSVMCGGGNVSMALPSRPKTLREASEMAKKLFE